jgi:hypothetical protein
MSYLTHWIPTFIGAALLAIVGFVLLFTERDHHDLPPRRGGGSRGG